MLPLPVSVPLLAIEASTTAGSVAIWVDGRLVGVEAVTMGAGQVDRLFPAMQRLVRGAELDPRALGAVVCGGGPGSFTSLRIAAALAKGMAHGAGCSLFAVPSLLVAGAAVDPQRLPDRFVVHADALRGERYAQPLARLPDGRLDVAGPLARVPLELLQAEVPAEARVAVLSSPLPDERHLVTPSIGLLAMIGGGWWETPVSLAGWEPQYGRLAEAQVKWEERHGMALPDAPLLRA